MHGACIVLGHSSLGFFAVALTESPLSVASAGSTFPIVSLADCKGRANTGLLQAKKKRSEAEGRTRCSPRTSALGNPCLSVALATTPGPWVLIYATANFISPLSFISIKNK